MYQDELDEAVDLIVESIPLDEGLRRLRKARTDEANRLATQSVSGAQGQANRRSMFLEHLDRSHGVLMRNRTGKSQFGSTTADNVRYRATPTLSTSTAGAAKGGER